MDTKVWINFWLNKSNKHLRIVQSDDWTIRFHRDPDE